MRAQRVAFLIFTIALLLWAAGQTEQVPVGAAVELSESGEAAPKYIALTFDDGPRTDTTGRLLDGLRERGANATFFLVGQRIAGNEDLVRRMKAEGHQVGNHSWSHVKLQGAPDAVVLEEVQKTDAALQKLLGEGAYWVRPPYGLLNQKQKSLFTVPLVHWSIDPEDWKVKNADQDVAAVIKNAKPGAIILMHDTLSTSVDAALRIVDELEAQGYTFVTVKELLALNGITPQNGIFYHTADESW